MSRLLQSLRCVVAAAGVMLPQNSTTGAEFSEGNLLVTETESPFGIQVLHEVTRSGGAVQAFLIPSPAATPRLVGDVVVDRVGRAHVLNHGFFTSGADFLSTYDPAADAWMHQPIVAPLTITTDSDLAILADTVYTRLQSISLTDFSTTDLPGFSGGTGDVVVGRDGLLYVVATAPRAQVTRFDPSDLSTPLAELMLQNSSGGPIDVRGLAVSDDGTRLYAAGVDGLIRAYDQNGVLIDTFNSLTPNLNNLDLAPDGTLAAGSTGGAVVVTDVDFTFLNRFFVSFSNVYVAHVAPPVEPDVEPEDVFSKEFVAGPDENGDGVIDRVVAVGQDRPTTYTFRIRFRQAELSAPAMIRDTVPAEWEVVSCEVASDPDGDPDVVLCHPAGRSGRSATKLEWLPTGNAGELDVTIQTRSRGRSRRNRKFAPTSCGALVVNNGARAVESSGRGILLDADGQQLRSNSLCLAAVTDLGGDGIDFTGNGDEDGDGLSDFVEACELGTDPCRADTDQDGVDDNVDADPLDGNVQ